MKHTYTELFCVFLSNRIRMHIDWKKKLLSNSKELISPDPLLDTYMKTILKTAGQLIKTINDLVKLVKNCFISSQKGSSHVPWARYKYFMALPGNRKNRYAFFFVIVQSHNLQQCQNLWWFAGGFFRRLSSSWSLLPSSTSSSS